MGGHSNGDLDKTAIMSDGKFTVGIFRKPVRQSLLHQLSEYLKSDLVMVLGGTQTPNYLPSGLRCLVMLSTERVKRLALQQP